MLVLSRQRDQSVFVDDNVEVRVVDIRGDKVRLGFIAPQGVKIYRNEVREQILARGISSRPVSEQEKAEMAPFLHAAIAEARKGLGEGGLPIGSVLVRGNQIIGRGHNRRVQQGDPMAHAEIDCLTSAGRQRTYRDTVLFSTLMPCYLCTGAVLQFGIPKVVVGESVNFPGGESKWGKSPAFMRANGIDLVDLHDAECIEMMGNFIREHPELWHEDIGVE